MKTLEETPLSQYQRLFVEAYVGDVVEAARLAGYKGEDSYLRRVGNNLLTMPKVQEALKKRSKFTAKTKDLAWGREERMEFWTQIAKNTDPYARQEMDKFGNPIPLELTPNIPMQQRLKATEMLGKAEGDFVDRIETNTTLTLQQIIMESYYIDDNSQDEMSIEDIEAEYRRVRDSKEIEYVEEDKGESSYDFL